MRLDGKQRHVGMYATGGMVGAESGEHCAQPAAPSKHCPASIAQQALHHTPHPRRKTLHLTGAVLLQGRHVRPPPQAVLARVVRLLRLLRLARRHLHLQHHSTSWHASPQLPGAQRKHAGGHAGGGASWHACKCTQDQ